MVSCLTACCSGTASNRVVPVVSAPTDYDFLQIDDDRRIRVIHLLPRSHWQGVANPSDGHRRQAATLSRPATGMEVDHGDGGACNGYGGGHAHEDEGDDDEEEYWFINSAPKRPPIVQPPPTIRQSRIIHKFEPREPPRIPGINPPRSRSNSLSNGNRQASASASARDAVAFSPAQRLPRKVILHSKELPDDEDDDDITVNEMAMDEEHVTASPVPPTDFYPLASSDEIHVVDGPHHPEVLSHMRKSPVPLERDTPSPEHFDKTVLDEPDPDPECPVDQQVKVVVEGGHLGGRANVAFDGEDDPLHAALAGAGHDHRDAVDAAATSKWPHREPLFGMRGKGALHKSGDSVANSSTSPNVRSIPSVSGSDIDLHVHPVLYFIHGIGGSARTWSSQIKYFNDLGYEIIAPDLLGHGFSSAPDSSKSYTFTKLFHDLVTILDHYVPETRHCVIVGHGYGCSLATALSRLRPNISLLVLLASGGPAPLAPPIATNRAKNDAYSLLAACLKPFLKCSFSKQRNYRPQGRTSKFPQPCDVPPYVIRHVVAGQAWPEGDIAFHRRISIPTLLVYGLKDTLVSLVEMCEMERTIPRAFLELVPLAGHMIQLDQPRQLSTMMNKFIEKYSF